MVDTGVQLLITLLCKSNMSKPLMQGDTMMWTQFREDGRITHAVSQAVPGKSMECGASMTWKCIVAVDGGRSGLTDVSGFNFRHCELFKIWRYVRYFSAENFRRVTERLGKITYCDWSSPQNLPKVEVHLTFYLYFSVTNRRAAVFCVGLLPSWLSQPFELRASSVCGSIHTCRTFPSSSWHLYPPYNEIY